MSSVKLIEAIELCKKYDLNIQSITCITEKQFEEAIGCIDKSGICHSRQLCDECFLSCDKMSSCLKNQKDFSHNSNYNIPSNFKYDDFIRVVQVIKLLTKNTNEKH